MSLFSVTCADDKSPRPVGRFPRFLSTCRGVVCLGMYVKMVLHFSLFGFAYAGRPMSPRNLSLERVTSNSAKVRWDVGGASAPTQFAMTVSSINGSAALSRVEDVDGTERNHTLELLMPETHYEVYMVAYNAQGQGSNVSDVIAFKTLPETTLQNGGLYVNPGEVLVVLIIIIAWICAIAMFLNKWSKIRIAPSGSSYTAQKPMNIESIKVVKKNTDSVIYNSYTKEINQTMLAREKRFQRMHTMPNIKVGKELEAEQAEFANKEKTLARMKTVPLLPVLAKGPPPPELQEDFSLDVVPKVRISRLPFEDKTVPLLAEMAEDEVSPDGVDVSDILMRLPELRPYRPSPLTGVKAKVKEKPLKRMRTSPLLMGVKEEPEMTSML